MLSYIVHPYVNKHNTHNSIKYRYDKKREFGIKNGTSGPRPITAKKLEFSYHIEPRGSSAVAKQRGELPVEIRNEANTAAN